MPSYSHRDLRAQRQALRLFGVVAVAAMALVAAGYLLPGSWVPALAVLGLAALGAGASWWGTTLVRAYEEDLRGAAAGDPRLPVGARLETLRRRSLGPSGDRPSGPSPHVRRPRAGAGGWSSGGGPALPEPGPR